MFIFNLNDELVELILNRIESIENYHVDRVKFDDEELRITYEAYKEFPEGVPPEVIGYEPDISYYAEQELEGWDEMYPGWRGGILD